MLLAYGVFCAAVNPAAANEANEADEADETGAARTYTLVALGDSLTAGYDLPQDKAFPVLLEQALRDAGHAVEVINAGVSGDTTAGGLARLDWVLADDPDGVIVELGANDGLRGLPPEETYRNLDRILTRLEERDIDILLAGMMAPPNLGRDYAEAFNAVFPRLAEAHDVVFYPFFLKNVAARPPLLLDDGMHPNARGVAVMVETIMPYVERLLENRADDGTR